MFTSAAPKGNQLSTKSTLNLSGCSDGEVRHVDGNCVTPIINRRLFLYVLPKNPTSVNRPEIVLKQKVERNLIFVRLPVDVQRQEPVILPPAEQQYIVYVLHKQSKQDQQVVDVPAPSPLKPEVFFVNYADGENPTLPGDVKLKRVLDSAFQGSGPVVGGSGGGGDGVETGGGLRYRGGNLHLDTGFTDGSSAGDLGDVDILTKDMRSLPNNPRSVPH